MSVLSLLVASCPILATLNLEPERREETSAFRSATRSGGRKLGMMAYPLADKSSIADEGKRGTEVLEVAEVSVAVDCSAVASLRYSYTEERYAAGLHEALIHVSGVGSVLETAGAREVGEKAFAIGTCAQNKVQIATAKAAAVAERCDWCSLMVSCLSSKRVEQSESRKCDKVMSQQIEFCKFLPI